MQGKKKKNQLVYKPYHQGSPWVKSCLKEALKILSFFLLFSILYVVAGSALSLDVFLLRLIMNGLMIFVCCGIFYTKGAALGENEVALGEIVYARLQDNKPVDENDKKQSFNKLRGWLIFAIGVLPILLITLISAFSAEKQMYQMQALPGWVSSFKSNEEIYAPLLFHEAKSPMTFAELCNFVSRILIFPYVCIFTTENLDTLLLLDKLSPILAVLPAVAFPVGYMFGPLYRARMHGDIARNRRKQKKKQKKQMQQRKMQREQKKNELI